MQNQDELAKDRGLNDLTAGLVQRVNLVKFVPHQQKVYLSFKQILQICGLALIFVLGSLFYSYGEQITLNKRVAKLQVKRDELVAKISSEQVKKMQELAGSDIIYTILQAEYAKNSPGFSQYLTAIAQACPASVWLASIEVKKRDYALTISGKAYRSADIVQLVDNLNDQTLFSRYPFFLAKISKTKEGTDTGKVKGEEVAPKKMNSKIIYNFTLQTKAAVEKI